MRDRSHHEDARALLDAGFLSPEEYEVVAERIADAGVVHPATDDDPDAWPVPAPEDRVDLPAPAGAVPTDDRGPGDALPPAGPSGRSIVMLVVLALIGGIAAYVAINSTSSDSTTPGPRPSIVLIDSVGTPGAAEPATGRTVAGEAAGVEGTGSG